MKYQFIEQYKQEFPVVVMCRMPGVSESGYDAWRKRLESQHKREDAHLTTPIQQIFVARRGVSGSPRIHADLKALGWRCSRKRVARLMRESGMDARRKRFRPITTKGNPKHLAVTLDVFSRRVIGWAMSTHCGRRSWWKRLCEWLSPVGSLEQGFCITPIEGARRPVGRLNSSWSRSRSRSA
jgi:hypothetical protein